MFYTHIFSRIFLQFLPSVFTIKSSASGIGKLSLVERLL